ncbi:phosphatidate cytidylyltransferase, mitochondrial isoform X3 [Tachypleus tridentatus]|uniref:phosphatidate cytidylyltransferase, mitochondrial isoform X3 n=2 Tax=Tachypleus tridentatus TaxID=6853 RepID=UPI003FD43332
MNTELYSGLSAIRPPWEMEPRILKLEVTKLTNELQKDTTGWVSDMKVKETVAYVFVTVQRNMIDLILAVNNPMTWHQNNLKLNRSHYSILKYGGSHLINRIQQGYGAGVYFNTLVPFEDRLIKYGIISTSKLITDLLDWDTLYVSGRLHKPVKVLHQTQDAGLEQALKVNLQSAIHATLLSLPETFTEEELYLQIACLSYTGDFRMFLGEDKNKVNNIVRPQLDRFRNLYSDYLNRIPQLEWNCKTAKYQKDCNMNNQLHHLNLLPKKVQHHLYVACNKDGRHRDMEDVMRALANDIECGDMVTLAVRDIVWQSSWSQSLKGILTAGIYKSLKYSFRKIVKMTKSMKTIR